MFRRIYGLSVAVLLMLGLVVPTALADDSQEREFRMLEDFAAVETGASGSGESDVDGDFVEIEVEAEGLEPNHQYEMKVTITSELRGNGTCCKGPVSAGVVDLVSCGWEDSDDGGEVEFECDLDLVELLGSGTYRLDFFVTHIHSTDLFSDLSIVLDRDPLLRCAPASVHTVPQDDD